MFITSKKALQIAVTRNGKRQIVLIRPGRNDYPMVDPKDPNVAEQLRIFRKHGAASFDEMLPSDVAIHDAAVGTPEQKAAALDAAITLKTNVSVAVPIPKSAGTDSPNRAASKRMVSDVGTYARPSEDARAVSDAEQVDGEHRGGGPVSGKGKHQSR